MKGLLFKDLYIGRKNYIINISVALVFIIAGLLIRASMVYGNLQMYYQSLDATTYYLFSVAPSLLLSPAAEITALLLQISDASGIYFHILYP